jgi:glutamate-1-semialdehyde 2,1-aminomutase
VVDHLWRYGARLFEGISDISRSLGIAEHFYMEGGYAAMNYVTKDQQGNASLEYRTLFAQEMLKHRILMPWIAVSLAHGEKELRMTFEAAEKSLRVYREALRQGISKYLVGPAIKPVFRKTN